ncbi:hypothetical protein PENSPDRAFT_247767 [Peniophora sp. CONT]|nr:hypothetical protein PENSPDRAFT_247767 [Peniophora sp. CONT]
MASEYKAAQQHSERFAAEDADVELLSSDNVLFKVHRASLASHSAVFPGQEVVTNGEIVSLSESSAVLDIILQYIYPSPPCHLDGLPFTTLYQVAEAAEKYQMFAVMEICRILLQIRHYQEHPLEVLAYACKYGYTSLCDQVAPLTLVVEARDAFNVLGHLYFPQWMLYREQWVGIQRSLPTYMDMDLGDIKKHWGACDERWYTWKKTCDDAVSRGDILRRLRDPDSLLASVMAINVTGHCPGCTWFWNKRRDRLRQQVAGVRDFSAIL